MSKNQSRAVPARRRVDRMVSYGARLSHGYAWPYWRLVDSVRQSTSLLHHRNFALREPKLKVRRIVLALSKLSMTSEHWNRPPETYVPQPSTSLYNQWIGLVGHLLEQYPCPNWMATSWLQHECKPWWFELHSHLARGENPRMVRFPIYGRCNRSLLHWLMKAPSDATPCQAFRWAQVISLQKQFGQEPDTKFARQVMFQMPMSLTKDEERLNESLTRFFVKNPVEPSEMSQMIIVARRQPSNSNRPFDPSRYTLYRFRELMRTSSAPAVSQKSKNWLGIALDDATFEDYPDWQIVQLKNSGELWAEGKYMKHCVGSYTARCRRGVSSIWSMRNTESPIRRAVTIEIDPTKLRVVQVKGYSNRRPNAFEKSLIRLWANQTGIEMKGI